MPYQDGPFPSGSPILVNAAGYTFKCNSFSRTPSAETDNITDENGVYSGALQFSGPITVQAEVQYANNNVPELCPASVNSLHGVFVNVPMPDWANNVANTVNKNVFITNVTTSKPQRGAWTASVTGQVRAN